MATKPGSWWRQRDPVAERFADNIVPRTAVHWPEHHHPTDAADDIPAPGDVDVRQRIAADAALDPDGAFARLDRMQRRMEGQIAAARDWRDDPDNVAWADHPFIGPMLEQGRGDDLMRLADPGHQESLRAAFGQTVGLALGAAASRPVRSPEDEAWKAREKNAPGSPWLGVDPPMPPDPPTYRPEGYPGGTPATLPPHISARYDPVKNKATDEAHAGPWGGRAPTHDLREKLLALHRDQAAGRLTPDDLAERRKTILDDSRALSRRPWWRDEFSNGCSVPLGMGYPPEFEAACRAHDRAYYEAAIPRVQADTNLVKDLHTAAQSVADPLRRLWLETHIPIFEAGVRTFGGGYYGKP